MDTRNQTIWDIAVIGGGPAGMMAAGRAAELGAKVVLIEKNDGLGKKLLLTSGGVAPEEVDFKTMASRLFSNLYLIGDILNIDRPSGGYSLQLCWTTGFVAGTAAANDLKTREW